MGTRQSSILSEFCTSPKTSTLLMFWFSADASVLRSGALAQPAQFTASSWLFTKIRLSAGVSFRKPLPRRTSLAVSMLCFPPFTHTSSDS